MRVRLILIVFVGLLVLTGYLLVKLSNPKLQITDGVLAAKFEELSSGGNSSCSQDFKDSIANMLDTSRLQGSCCSPMDFHRYTEQVEGLKKYSDIPEIPPDPYDIKAGLAKKLLGYYEV